MFEIISICKGGGYQYCRTEPKHPNANTKGLYPLHRVMMENKLGRLLEYNDNVHHIDGDTTNDDIDNLELISKSDHTKHHAVVRRVDSIECVCPVCEKEFSVKPHWYRTRIKRNKSNKIACSRSCGAYLK